MAEGAGLGRRAGTVALWPVGMGLASWRYLWRTSPMHRYDEDGGPQDAGPPLADDMLDERVQRPEDGAGPFYRRQYSVRIEGSTLVPEQLMALITENPNRAVPVEVAVFRKIRGEEGSLAAGDEYLVRMPGPWDGPVRVVARSATMFRLATPR